MSWPCEVLPHTCGASVQPKTKGDLCNVRISFFVQLPSFLYHIPQIPELSDHLSNPAPQYLSPGLTKIMFWLLLVLPQSNMCLQIENRVNCVGNPMVSFSQGLQFFFAAYCSMSEHSNFVWIFLVL